MLILLRLLFVILGIVLFPIWLITCLLCGIYSILRYILVPFVWIAGGGDITEDYLEKSNVEYIDEYLFNDSISPCFPMWYPSLLEKVYSYIYELDEQKQKKKK